MAAVSLVYWLFVAVAALALFPIALVLWALTVPFDRRRVAMHGFTSVWASLYTWMNPLWSVSIAARDKIQPDRTYMMVANHNSMVDIFVLYRLFAHFKWVSKVEVFRLPCIGWNMYLCGYIPLRRGDKASIVTMLAACQRALEAGNSVMMFPEGTRSKTGELKPFKPGAFEIALKAGIAVLPIAVQGTHRALPKHGFAVGRSAMRITVLDPIDVPQDKEPSAEAVADLATRARDAIQAHLV